MSTKIMALCWPLQMSPTQKSVLISLADNANDDGVCWPRMKLICERTCLSERAIRIAIRDLELLGFVVSEIRDGRSNSYTVTPPGFVPDTHDLGAASRAPTPARGAPTPASPAPLTTLEPSLNPQETVNARFEQFWKSYPKKVAKPTAERAFAKCKFGSVDFPVMMANLDRQKISEAWTKDRGQFIPHPATWLNQRRWEDELPQMAAPRSTAAAAGFREV